MTISEISNKKSLLGSNTLALLVLTTVALALAIDTYFAKQFLFSQTSVSETINAFTIISVICIVGQYLILAFVRYKSHDLLRRVRRLRVIYFSVIVVQNFVTALFVILLLQVYLTSSYNSSIAISASLIAYTLALAVILYLAQLFF
jgi:uncharacterized membrane protein